MAWRPATELMLTRSALMSAGKASAVPPARASKRSARQATRTRMAPRAARARAVASPMLLLGEAQLDPTWRP
jgi:hypothetical protein